MLLPMRTYTRSAATARELMDAIRARSATRCRVLSTTQRVLQTTSSAHPSHGSGPARTVVVDPKSIDLRRYSGATVLSPQQEVSIHGIDPTEEMRCRISRLGRFWSGPGGSDC